jgi:hydroxymethylpyrimidine pyrophosphatase-like HAD family hydrolase
VSVLVATDLDRTLIYSAAAAGRPVEDLVAVEHLDGRPISYMTADGLRLLAALAAEHVVVPVTTRTPEQLARVRLPGAPQRYAVAANGGVLLVDGTPDPDWAERVRAAVAGAAPVEEALAVLDAACDPAGARPPRIAAGLFCYRVVERALLPAEVLAGLAAWAGPAGWVVSLQGRKLYLVPRGLTKSSAVAEVARRAGTATTLAAGDSLLDRDLLEAADLGVRPGHGEIHDSGWAAPHVRALTSAGIAAGEDILRWFGVRAAEALGERTPPAVPVGLPTGGSRSAP